MQSPARGVRTTYTRTHTDDKRCRRWQQGDDSTPLPILFLLSAWIVIGIACVAFWALLIALVWLVA